jgi:DNA-binding NarL/FixJ family response regulator
MVQITSRGLPMEKDIRVLIIEDDEYSRNMMAMLLTRDWRTRVVGELNGHDDLGEYVKQPVQQVDVILIGVETPSDQDWPFRVLQVVSSFQMPPVVLYAGTRVDYTLANHISSTEFGGYVLKSEVLYSLATAITLAARGHCVITPGVRSWVSGGRCAKPVKVIDGTRRITDFSRRESEIVHLGILFNLSQRDIADELVIGTDWISEAMGNIYEKLGLHEILSGHVSLDQYFEDEIVLARCKSIVERAHKSSRSGRLRKAPWMSTLAFHLLTTPFIEEL